MRPALLAGTERDDAALRHQVQPAAFPGQAADRPLVSGHHRPGRPIGHEAAEQTVAEVGLPVGLGIARRLLAPGGQHPVAERPVPTGRLVAGHKRFRRGGKQMAQRRSEGHGPLPADAPASGKTRISSTAQGQRRLDPPSSTVNSTKYIGSR